jgi:hypothetical protein
MKKICFALVVAAVLPVAAHATSYEIDETLKFTASSSTASFLLSWEDLIATNAKKGWTTEVDGKYSLTLFDTVNKVTVFKDKSFDLGDVAGLTSGSFTQTFDSLSAGVKYRLNFSGSWNGPSGKNWSSSAPSISVAAASVVTSVPEPENYAMLLAGLGVIGAIARRKSA